MSRTDNTPNDNQDPCLNCGACFRVSFYWAETEIHAIPEHAIEQLTPVYACMTGTNSNTPHCHALQGEVGQQVHCNLYAHRPSPCREVQPGDDKCNQARAAYQLPPILATVS